MSTDVLAVTDEIVAALGKGRELAIPVLQRVQNRLRYIPRPAIERIAATTEMSEAQLFGVATFYSQFRLEPVGDRIVQVCHGTACHVGGAEGITEALERKLGVKNGETTPDGKITLTSVACLGCCSLAPVMMVVDDKAYGRLDRKRAVSIAQDLGGGAGGETASS